MTNTKYRKVIISDALQRSRLKGFILIRNRGFNLIELVVVIVVLGILAVIAIPKFFDLSTDAQVAKIEGMQAAMLAGTQLINAKAEIENKTVGENTISVDGKEIHLHSGYPIGNWINGIRYIVNLDSLYFTDASITCDVEWCGRGSQTKIPSGVSTTAPGQIGKVFPAGYSWNDQCGVYYMNHENGTAAVIGIETSDC